VAILLIMLFIVELLKRICNMDTVDRFLELSSSGSVVCTGTLECDVGTAHSAAHHRTLNLA
jgi:hypothetical protein